MYARIATPANDFLLELRPSRIDAIRKTSATIRRQNTRVLFDQDIITRIVQPKPSKARILSEVK